MLLVSGNWINDFRRPKSLHLLHQSFPILPIFRTESLLTRFYPFSKSGNSQSRKEGIATNLSKHFSPWAARFRNSLAGKISPRYRPSVSQCLSRSIRLEDWNKKKKKKILLFVTLKFASRPTQIFDPNKIFFLPLKLNSETFFRDRGMGCNGARG